jgi:hypothetical protein
MEARRILIIVICILALSMFACGTATQWEEGWEGEAGPRTIEAWQNSGFVCDLNGHNCTLPDAGGW